MAASSGLRRVFQLRQLAIGLGCSSAYCDLLLFGLLVGLGLRHLLLGFRQIGLGLAQLVFLLRGVELHYHFARLHQFAGIAQDT